MKLKNTSVYLTLLATILILASNVIPFPMLRGEPAIQVYKYEDKYGIFSGIEIPKKGRTLAMVQHDYASLCIVLNCEANDLHRNFEFKPWWFWRWVEYLTNPRWRLPYKALKDDAQ